MLNYAIQTIVENALLLDTELSVQGRRPMYFVLMRQTQVTLVCLGLPAYSTRYIW